MALVRSANEMTNEALRRLERMARSIIPLQDEIHRETAKLAPLLPAAKPTQISRLLKVLSPQGE